MPVLIDPPRWPGHGHLWSHLVSDESLDQLHAFARRLGLRSFDADHYDVPAERYDEVVAAGAVEVSGRELLRRLIAAGLRVPKRKGEWVVRATPIAGGTHELLLSPLDHLTDLRPGGRIQVLEPAGGRLDEVTDLPAGAVPIGLARRRGSDGSITITDVVYAAAGSRPSSLNGLPLQHALRENPLWPLLAAWDERSISRPRREAGRPGIGPR